MAVHWIRGRAVLRALLVAASLVGLLLAGIGSANAATVTVAAVNFEFQPASRTVHVGDVVRWTFSGDPHTVTSGTPGAPDGRFDSGIKEPGGSFQVTLDATGTYRYFCQIHPEQMVGTIVVTEGSASTPKPTAKATTSPTAKPTARPTAGPTAKPTPKPTVAPAATRSPSPSPAAPATHTLAPSATLSATPPTASPTGSSGSIGAVAPSSTHGAAPGAPSSATNGDSIPIVAAVVVLGLLSAGGLALARRWRSG